MSQLAPLDPALRCNRVAPVSNHAGDVPALCSSAGDQNDPLTLNAPREPVASGDLDLSDVSPLERRSGIPWRLEIRLSSTLLLEHGYLVFGWAMECEMSRGRDLEPTRLDKGSTANIFDGSSVS